MMENTGQKGNLITTIKEILKIKLATPKAPSLKTGISKKSGHCKRKNTVGK